MNRPLRFEMICWGDSRNRSSACPPRTRVSRKPRVAPPGQPAVGWASTPCSPEERRMKPLVAAVPTAEVIALAVRAGRLTPGESNDTTLTGIGTSVAPA